MAMKWFLFAAAVGLLAAPAVRADEDVWYDANGKVVRVTPAEEEREAFVPDWKKRETARLEAQREGNERRRFRRSRTQWYSGYDYGGYYYGGYPGAYRCGPYLHHHHDHHHHPRWRFRGSYHGSGWSVRVGF